MAKGWYGEKRRHQEAARYGKASYTRNDQVIPSKVSEKDFVIKEVPRSLRDDSWEIVKGGLKITRNDGSYYVVRDKNTIEDILWHGGLSLSDVGIGDKGRVRD